MPRQSQTQLRDWWLSHCGWCHREIGEDEPRLAAGLKFSDPKDYRKARGRAIEFKLASGRSVIARGVMPDSQAKKVGKDLLVGLQRRMPRGTIDRDVRRMGIEP